MTKTRPMTGITERMTSANVAISNALSDAQIGILLGEYGYQTQKLSEGKVLCEAADAAVKRQVANHGDQKKKARGVRPCIMHYQDKVDHFVCNAAGLSRDDRILYPANPVYPC